MRGITLLGIGLVFSSAGCLGGAASQELDMTFVADFSGLHVDGERLEQFAGEADAMIAAADDGSLGPLKEALCKVQGAGLATQVLSKLNGVSFKLDVDLVEYLTAGTSPVGLKGGVEMVQWFNGDGTSQRHFFLIPEVTADPTVSPLGGEVSAIFGCESPEEYSGYFASAGIKGLHINVGLDLESLFLSLFQAVSPDSGEYRFQDVMAAIGESTASLRELAGSPNFFLSASTSDVLQAVALTLPGDSGVWDWETDLGTLYRRGQDLVASELYRDGENQVDSLFREAATVSRQPGETLQEYAIRLPVDLPRFDALMERVAGGEQGTMESPSGWLQTLSSVEGLGGGVNMDVALNSAIYSTDGPYLGSVKGNSVNAVTNTMLGDATYGCGRQRERYPAGRWFRVYVQDNAYVFDCYGFGAGETRSGSAGFSFLEASFRATAGAELSRVASFYRAIGELRVSVSRARNLTWDAVRTKRNVLALELGGTRAGNGDVLTGCGSVSLDERGLAGVSTLKWTSIAPLVTAIATRSPRKILKALRSADTAGLSYNYHVYSSQPVLQSRFASLVESLRGVSCDS